jgi:hypothetical protein
VTYTPAQQRVVDLLGRRADVEPARFDVTLAVELGAFLESELAPLAGAIGDQQVWVSKHALGSVHGCEAHHLATDGDFSWSVAMVRGSVAHKAIELSVFWRGEPNAGDLVEEALERLANDDRGLGRFLQSLTESDRAQLLGEANGLVAGFLESFPPLSKKWRPVCESRSYVELLGGKVVLSGKVDLTLGMSREGQAGKVIIDLKSGSPVLVHRDDLRFYALVETLKLGVPPRMLATYYLDAARAQPEEVTEELLWAAARRTADGVHKIVELTLLERAPAVRPGPTCRWCPALERCAPGLAHLEAAND